MMSHAVNKKAFSNQLEDISCPQLYPRACICLMMYFKYNWNAGPFFYFMDFLEEKTIYI
jgi:hypothetical protein